MLFVSKPVFRERHFEWIESQWKTISARDGHNITIGNRNSDEMC